MIGHKGHPEVEGTMGQFDATGIHLVEDIDDVAALAAARPAAARVRHADHAVGGRRGRDHRRAASERFPSMREPKKQDICYATQNRQDAVKFMAPQCDVLIVVGSPTAPTPTGCASSPKSSACLPTWSTRADQIDPEWVEGKRRIGVTAGASAPEVLVQAVIARLARARRAQRARA